MKRSGRYKESIPHKANRILNILLCVFALMLLRIWHLAVVQHEERLELARRPRERVVIDPAERAAITDRFGLPIAQNRVGYQATLIYAQITELPTVQWRTRGDGKRVKHYPRREHISQLSAVLAEELGRDPRRIEDEIHAKAALYYQRPYVLADGITEEQYYRLRMLEKDWIGLHARQIPIREYPNGRIASHIVGYVGAINRQEYEEIVGEIRELESFLKAWETGEPVPFPALFNSASEVVERLKELKKFAYTVRDTIGKSGIEGRFEEELRGFQGKRRFYADAKGNFLRELDGGESPQPGKGVQLALSLELQEFAEKLLVESEEVREGRSYQRNRVTGSRRPLRQPWLKGGAVVVMDPNTGELLAMASSPRYDPNDFVNQHGETSKHQAILRWLEAEAYLANIWDGKQPEFRERICDGRIIDEQRWIDWDCFLESILPKNHPILKHFNTDNTVGFALKAQSCFSELMHLLRDEQGIFNAYDVMNILFPEKPYRQRKPWGVLEEFQKRVEEQEEPIVKLKKDLDRILGKLEHNYDKVLFLDLCQLAADPNRFDDGLSQVTNALSISDYKKLSRSFFSVQEALKEMMRGVYHEIDWSLWKEKNGREWLKLKRQEEKDAGRYARPYLDLYDRKEAALFESFWEKEQWKLLSVFFGKKGVIEAELKPYLDFCSLWHKELVEGAHRALSWVKRYLELQERFTQDQTSEVITLLKSMRRFKELNRPLWGSYRSLRRDPDQIAKERHLALAFYPRYGYGSMRSTAYRHYCTQGSIFKIITAYEALRQYLVSLGGDCTKRNLSPFFMDDELFRTKSGWNVGRWSNGEPIPRLYKGGCLPRSYKNLGKIDLVEALAHSANPYFAILAVDYLEKPSDLADAAARFGYGKRTGIELPGELAGGLPVDLDENITGVYSLTMGQHTLINTPLQTSVMLSAIANGGTLLKPQIVKKSPEIKEQIDLPESVQRHLLEAMRRGIESVRKENGGTLSYVYRNHASKLRNFLNLEGEFIGKSSTTEQVEVIDLDLENGANIYNHIWFGGIAYSEKKTTSFLSRDAVGQAELVVVVYLPFGGYGKESLPIAAELIREWRRIKEKYS